jgi:hypothetical protein
MEHNAGCSYSFQCTSCILKNMKIGLRLMSKTKIKRDREALDESDWRGTRATGQGWGQNHLFRFFCSWAQSSYGGNNAWPNTFRSSDGDAT